MTDNRAPSTPPTAFITGGQAVIRHLMGSVAGFFAINGVTTAQFDSAVAGISVVILTILWSFIDKKLLSRKPKGE